MSVSSYELEVHRQGTCQMMDQLVPGSGLGAQATSLRLGCYPSQPYQSVHYCYCSPPRDLNAFEIVIEQLSTEGEPLLNYGAKLRLLLADPYLGVELREALHKLKIALKEAIQHAS